MTAMSRRVDRMLSLPRQVNGNVAFRAGLTIRPICRKGPVLQLKIAT